MIEAFYIALLHTYNLITQEAEIGGSVYLSQTVFPPGPSRKEGSAHSVTL